MVNPVEKIAAARGRLARVAAIRIALYPIAPAIAAILAAALFTILGRITWEPRGYIVDSPAAEALRMALAVAGVATLAAAAVAAWIAYRRADNFVAAAEQVDSIVGGREEIVTLAILTDPENVERGREGRTPLFPVLWRRVMGYLEGFDPVQAFKIEARRPMMRSLAMAAGVLMLTAGVTAALVRLPTPGELEARKLREIARSLASSSNPIDRALAAETMAAADSLENPAIPPEEKMARLDALKKDLENEEDKQTASSASATGAGAGKSGGKGAGSGQGASQGNGKGSANGSGAGKGNGGNKGSGSGQNQGGGGDKNQPQMAELKNEVADAQAQIQSPSGDQSNAPSPANKAGKGDAMTAGQDQNKKGPSPEPGAKGQANRPKPDAQATSEMAGGATSGPRNNKGSSGDTHLGEMPASERFQRFYKAGDKGPPMELKDARYVLFRLPPEAIAGGTGPLVRDTSRPTATVPYSNVPLKQNRLDVTPEEQQFVPPRYRDLIH